MNAPMANLTGLPILRSSWANFRGSNLSAIQGLQTPKSNSGTPTRNPLGPKPSKGSKKLVAPSRFASKASTSGDFGATTPQPKIPILLFSSLIRRTSGRSLGKAGVLFHTTAIDVGVAIAGPQA